MISENVANRDSEAGIREAFHDMGASGHTLIRRDSTGIEQDHFLRLAGNENNYPMMNIASRNREFRDHDIDEIELWEDPPVMSVNYCELLLAMVCCGRTVRVFAQDTTR